MFDSEEFVGRHENVNEIEMVQNKQLNFYPQNDINANENIAGSSDDADGGMI
jgi:hypothetical protein